MNIYDIAKKSGVSTATVSRVINNSGYVGDLTRRKVLSVIEENNFIPNAFAKKLSTNDSLKLIGLLCYKIDDLYYAKSVSILEKELRNYGYDIILCCTGNSIPQIENNLSILLSKNVDAIILIGSVFIQDGRNEHIEKASKHLPVFLINGDIDCENAFSVFCDDYMATSEIAQKIIKSGYKNIHFIYDTASYSGKRKLKGYREALKSVGLKDTSVVCDSYESAFNYIKNEILSGNKIDAVLTANDELAAGAHNAFKSFNIEMPKDAAVVGYNNSLIAESCGITSLENSVVQISTTIAKNIYRYFNGEKVKKSQVVPYSLVRRSSF